MKAVPQEDGFSRERQATVGAEEYAFIMPLEVVEHGAAMAEAVFALRAREAPGAPLVRSNVLLALCDAGEDALAEIALIKLVLEVVRVQMLLQVFPRRKLCGANDALDAGCL